MRIKQLSERSGVSRHTIRYYEKLGLLMSAGREPGNRYRDYTEGDLERLTIIGHAKRMGMRLSTIGEHLAAFTSGELGGSALRALFEQQLREIETRERELAEFKAYLREKIARVDAGEL